MHHNHHCGKRQPIAMLRFARRRMGRRSASAFAALATTWLCCCICAAVGSAADPGREGPGGAAASQAEAPPLPAAVQAVLATKPTKPDELLRAARTLAGLGQPELARQMLKRVLDAQLDAAALADLAERFGSPVFVGLATQADVQPEGAELAKRVLDAWQSELQSPQRIARNIESLADPSEAKRAAAARSLLAARHAAIGPLLSMLLDASRTAEHSRGRAVLVAMGSEAAAPLAAVVESDDAAAAVEAARLLGEMKAKDGLYSLLAPALATDSPPELRAAAATALQRMRGSIPTAGEAAALLAQRAREHHEGSRPTVGVIEGRATDWSWDKQKKAVVGRPVPEPQMRRSLAARLARSAHQLDTNDARIRLLHVATMLEEEAYRVGRGQPLPHDSGSAAERAAAFGAAVLEDVLQHALATDHPAAGAAAIEILSRIGSADELLMAGPRPGPVALALTSPDRRLRLAAAKAITGWAPKRPFAGASQLAPALAWFAQTRGTPRVLLAGPIAGDLRTIAGALTERKIQADLAALGSEATLSAVSSPDYLYVVLDMQLTRPQVDLVVQQLRRDPRSAELPIGLMARDGLLPAAERLARTYRGTLALPRPHGDDAIAWQSEKLEALWGENAVDDAERIRQATEALDMLAVWAKSEAAWFELRKAEPAVLSALRTPSLVSHALELAALLGTPAAQQTLVGLASEETNPLDVRTAAVERFGQSVKKHGILLTAAEIERQYARYNQSAAAPPETQKVLGALLDVIESRIRKSPSAEPKKSDSPEQDNRAETS